MRIYYIWEHYITPINLWLEYGIKHTVEKHRIIHIQANHDFKDSRMETYRCDWASQNKLPQLLCIIIIGSLVIHISPKLNAPPTHNNLKYVRHTYVALYVPSKVISNVLRHRFSGVSIRSAGSCLVRFILLHSPDMTWPKIIRLALGILAGSGFGSGVLSSWMDERAASIWKRTRRWCWKFFFLLAIKYLTRLILRDSHEHQMELSTLTFPNPWRVFFCLRRNFQEHQTSRTKSCKKLQFYPELSNFSLHLTRQSQYAQLMMGSRCEPLLLSKSSEARSRRNNLFDFVAPSFLRTNIFLSIHHKPGSCALFSMIWSEGMLLSGWMKHA